MSTVAAPDTRSVVVLQRTTVVAVRETGGTPVVTPQIGRGAVVVTRGAPGRKGDRGDPGPAGGETLVPVGATPLSGHSIVAVDAGGELIPADSTNPTHPGTVLGLLASAYSPGEDASVQTGFVIEHSGWNWAPGFLFVGSGGQPVQVLPPGAVFSQTVGKVLSPTRVLVDIQPPIFLQ
ncbi:hypothetical protein [Acidovorax sp. Leaf84]|uniref:hypothetical protein n=1 Tax=Acidovorax sp. Leaf84 TaxID=1736240 RepID=UPI0012E2FB0D|nr:hypothetical protein [Acidovorax sp. Leaf84]